MGTRTLFSAALGALLVTGAGCATAPAVGRAPKAVGTAAVEGELSLIVAKNPTAQFPRGFDELEGRAARVYLRPVDAATNAWFGDNVFPRRGDGAAPPGGDSPLARSARTDGAGRFALRELPAGDYYLVANVAWDAPVQGLGRGMTVPLSTWLGGRVLVEEGETLRVVLSR